MERIKPTVTQRIYNDMAAAQIREFIKGIEKGIISPVAGDPLIACQSGSNYSGRYFELYFNCDPFIVKYKKQFFVFDKQPWGALESFGPGGGNMMRKNPIENAPMPIRVFKPALLLHSLSSKGKIDYCLHEYEGAETISVELDGRKYYFETSRTKQTATA